LALPASLYGGLVASSLERDNVTAIDGVNSTERALTPELPLQQYPGLALPHIRVYALDAYDQVMTMDRNVVIHLELLAAGASISGTVLRAIDPLTGATLFDDIVLSAQPGSYTLRFEATSTHLDVSATVSLEVLPSCPTGLHYDTSAQQCRRCAADFLVWDGTLQSCVPCAAGWEVQNVDGAHVCRLCPLGQTSSSGGGCGSCNTYQPFAGAECESCILDGMEGLNCDQLVAGVNLGWFAYSVISEDEGLPRAQTVKCPEGFCAGGLIQSDWSDNSLPANGSSSMARTIPRTVITRFDQCAHPRLAAEDNIMCGQCVEGYIAWGDKCAHCESANGGMVFLLIVLSLLLLVFLIRSATLSSTAGHSVVVLYFIQTAMLEVGGASKLLSWLNIALFSPNTIGECIAPLSPYQQTQVQIVMPLFLFAELLSLAGLHYLAHRRWAAVAQAEGRVAGKGASLFAHLRSSALGFVGSFIPDLYISASLSLLLFSYTQVAAACLSYLACVDVGDVSVVFSQPSMRCASDEYQRTLVLVIFALAVYVAGFPLAVLLFLWMRSDLVRNSHLLIAAYARAQAKAASADGPNDSANADPDGGVDVGSIADLDTHGSGSGSASSPTAAAAHFLRRYSPLFSMYSSSAWFWQVFVLIRRTVFVAVSVTLVRSRHEGEARRRGTKAKRKARRECLSIKEKAGGRRRRRQRRPCMGDETFRAGAIA